MKVGSLALAAFAMHGATGCSEFLYNGSNWDATADGPIPVMSGRTMDYASDLQSALKVVPRGTTFQELPTLACADCASYNWSNSFGFVAVNIQDLSFATDGLNEKGLSAAWLAIPEAITSHVDSRTSDTRNSDPELPVVASISTYVLGNFASVNEVREGLNRIQFAGFDDRLLSHLFLQDVTARNNVPLYLSVRDSRGENLVVEFLDGKTTLYDDLEHFLAADLDQRKTGNSQDGAVLREFHPVYRVQRISAMNHNVRKKSSRDMRTTPAQHVVSTMLHILNTVRQPDSEAWSFVRDHKSLQLFIRSAQNQQLRRVELTQIDFASASSRRSIPLTHGDWFIDIPSAPAEGASAKTSASQMIQATELMAQERSSAPVRPHDRLSWFSFLSGLSWGAILTLGAIYGAPWIAMLIRRRRYKQIHDLAYC